MDSFSDVIQQDAIQFFTDEVMRRFIQMKLDVILVPQLQSASPIGLKTVRVG